MVTAGDMETELQPAEESVMEPVSLELSAWREWAQTQQQTWLEKIGDHEYHFIDKSKSLEMKVGYALYGLPTEVTNLYLYTQPQCEYITKMCSKISEESAKMSSNGIYFSVVFIYCFTEESKFKLKFWEKEEKEAFKFQNVVFKITEGLGSKEIKFIDMNFRVYDSWDAFKVDNVYPKCMYALPKDGKYQKDINSNVLIEFEKSPDCTLKRRLLNNLDTGGMVVGLGSAVVMAASIFVPVAAPVFIGSAVAGGVGGAYSAGRNIGKLVDRHTHNQSINPMDKEALLVWIDLSMAVLTVGMSACSAVSSLKAASTASSAATAGGEAATSASNVAKSSEVVTKASKGSKAAAKAAAKLGNGTKIASTGSRAASAAKPVTNIGKAATNLSQDVVNVAGGTAKVTKATKNAVNAGQKATKIANEVSKTSKVAKSAIDISSNASKAADGASKVTKTTLNAVDAGQTMANAAKTSTETLKTASDITTLGSTKASKVAKVGKKVVKASRAANRAQKVAKMGGGLGSKSGTASIVSPVVTDDVKLASKISKFFSFAPSIDTPISSSTVSLSTASTGASSTFDFEKLVSIGLKALFSITFELVSSNVSSKHKEALEQVLILFQKHRTCSLETTDITRFMSYMNFYFNTLIVDHEAFLENFKCKLFDIVRRMFSSEIFEYRVSKSQTQICHPKISADGDEILTSVFADLQSSDVFYLAEIQHALLQSNMNEIHLPDIQTQNMQMEQLNSTESNYPIEATSATKGQQDAGYTIMH